MSLLLPVTSDVELDTIGACLRGGVRPRTALRSARIVWSASVLASSILVGRPALAQDCPYLPWPTTQFEVIHRRTPLDIEMWLGALLNETLNYDTEMEQAQETADAAWDRLMEDYLHDIAERYQAAGFGCPDLNSIRVDGELRYVVYLVDLGDHVLHGWSPASGVNPQHPWFPNHILIDREDFTAAAGTDEQQLYATLAHELFHAVQASYDGRYSSFRSVPSTRLGEPGIDFAVEGGANGVDYAMVSERFPGYRESHHASSIELGAYPYDYENFVAAPADDGKAYETGSFWFHIAERYGGLSTIEYFLRQPLAGLSTDERVRWVERGLSARLHEVFPHFLTELASYGWSRYEAVSPERWLGDILFGCRERDSLDPGPPVLVTLEDSHAPWHLPGMSPITGRCVRAEWNVEMSPEAMSSVALQVEIAGPNKAVLEQLHVGLAHGSIDDGNCWEKMKGLIGPQRRQVNCVTRPDGTPLERGDHWIRSWTLPPGNWGNDGHATIVISNVAETSTETLDAEDLGVRFRFLKAFARITSIESSGGSSITTTPGPSGTDVDQPLGIQLDSVPPGRLFQAATTRYPYDPSLAEPCVLSVGNLFNGQGDMLGFRMDHEGPIGPGSYPVTDGRQRELKYGDPLPPAQVEAGFVLGFLNQPPAEQLQSFIGVAGTLTVHSVDGRFVTGTLHLTGENRRASAIARGWEPPPSNYLPGAAIHVEFRLVMEDPGDPQRDSGAINCLTSEPTGGWSDAGGGPTDPPPDPGDDPDEGSSGSSGSGDSGGTGGPPEEGSTQPGSDQPSDPTDDSASDARPSESDVANLGPGGTRWVRVRAEGRPDLSFYGSDVDGAAGAGISCHGTATPTLIGLYKGRFGAEELSLSALTAGIAEGATGVFPLAQVQYMAGARELEWTGTGTLEITRHDPSTDPNSRRIAGRLFGLSMIDRDRNGPIPIEAEFDVNAACVQFGG